MNDILKIKRINAGFTQLQVAEKVGVTERGYRYYEADKRTPDAKTAIKIAKALNTTVEELWGSSSQNFYH